MVYGVWDRGRIETMGRMRRNRGGGEGNEDMTIDREICACMNLVGMTPI